jgi:hypothetical protein
MPVMKPGWVTTLHERLDRDGSSVDMLQVCGPSFSGIDDREGQQKLIARWQLQISRDFMYKPFEGCLISVTGLEAGMCRTIRPHQLAFFFETRAQLLNPSHGSLFILAKRDMLRKIIEEHGGTYSADMSKTCTHLVAETSEKV